MTRSLWWILAPLGGVVLLVVLWRGGRRLPPPLRRLVFAGMSLLAVLGVSPMGMVAWSAEPAASGGALEERDEWQRLERTFRDVEEIGKRGSYPFDSKGKAQILEAIAARQADVDALVAAGAIAAAEGGLIEEELERARVAMSKLRPTEMMAATCYKPMRHDPQGSAMGRLQTQLPLLEKVGTLKTVHPEVLRRAFENIERDLAALDGPGGDPEKQAEAKELGDRVRKAIARIEAKPEFPVPPAEQAR